MSKIYQGKGGFLADLVHGQTVKFYPRGGGFQSEIPLERFLEEFKEAELDTTLRPAWFAIDGGTRFPGYHRGDRWNGWAVPCFEARVALAIQDRWAGSDSPMVYDKEKDAFLWSPYEGEEPEAYEGEWVHINGRKEKVYGIGAGSWVWDAYETETGDE